MKPHTLTTILAVFVWCCATSVRLRCWRWNVFIHDLEQSVKTVPHTPMRKSVPIVVHRYLHHALPNESECTFVQFYQDGRIKMEDGRWLDFTAHQLYSTHGFMWHSVVNMTTSGLREWLPSIHIIDSWVRGGEGSLRVNVGGFYPLVDDLPNYQEELRQGEMVRWLAEAFVFPQVLWSDAVTWENIPEDPNAAVLSSTDSTTNTSASVKVVFKEDKIELSGTRPKSDGKTFTNRPWVGYLMNFSMVDGISVPAHMECGWMTDDGAVDLYFKADNYATDIHYDRVAVKQS